MTHVGILADTTALAASIATELHISRPLLLSPSNVANALEFEDNLGVVLVDDAQWPLNAHTAAYVIPAVARNLGYIIRLERINPLGDIPLKEAEATTK